MKFIRLILFAVTVGFAATTWSQNEAASAPAAAAAQTGSNDAIVKMRHEEAAANRAYDKKVAAAKKVFDHKKAEAKKERDAAIAAARYGTTQ
ncbi:hypothetical protein [Paraburkholderia caribensis]|jgi:hypothetical protein|uniref:DUF4148 domain-containing protein n=1 Tax=Paraburkholderia caribensis TaxID=75105 RepID=A0A9Q6WQ96_9BURK|nr:hypothetical protein [Paraburkholderia caribensis]MCO4879283.1 hypothetical protein [Paraburkholderia caribensis]MDR6386120.1 hypothetical protein [Paraburkholderia caribensis]PTB27421.1 hypothetical protein C9I56_18060 [Paraburkholderia caribensis]QLB67052.1 hypothetical protein A9O66_31655 [Paraburkholderia caribensis]